MAPEGCRGESGYKIDKCGMELYQGNIILIKQNINQYQYLTVCWYHR